MLNSTLKPLLISACASLLVSCSHSPPQQETNIEPFSVIKTINVGSAPHGFRVEGSNIFIANSGDDVIGQYDLTSGQLVKAINAPNVPLDLISSGDGWLVSQFSANAVVEMDRDGQILNTLAVGQSPSLFSTAPRGHISIVSERADQLTLLDDNGSSIVIPTGKRPYPAHVSSDGVLAFIPNRTDNTVTVYDLLNKSVLATTEVCQSPEGGTLTADEVSYMVACGGDDKIMFINTASFEVTHTLSEGIGSRPFSVLAGPQNHYAYVNNAGENTVSVIDLNTKTVIKQITVGTQPIVMRIFNDTLYVTNEVSGTLSVISIPEKAPLSANGQKNEVIMLGMIHGGHNTSELYSLAVLDSAFRKMNPDYVLTEIPPNRFDKAMQDWQQKGEILEPRVKRFPEYIGMLFPALDDMQFEIIPTAGWNTSMNNFRRQALDDIAKDSSREQQWQAYQASIESLNQALEQYTDDDPLFIHSNTYDQLIKQTYGGPYEQYFNDDLGTGGWKTINQAHYALIDAALNQHSGEGKRFVITYGAGHKYWFLEQLSKRDDIILLDTNPFFE